MFCGKCRKHYETGGSGTGRQYRCTKCHAERLAAMLTGEAKVRGRKWTPQELEVLENLWGTASIRDVYAAFPGRTQDSVRRAAERNGMYRPPELVTEAKRENALIGAEIMRQRREREDKAQEALLALNQVITRDFSPIKFNPDPLQQVFAQMVRA